jgi:hypothetical protein
MIPLRHPSATKGGTGKVFSSAWRRWTKWSQLLLNVLTGSLQSEDVYPPDVLFCQGPIKIARSVKMGASSLNKYLYAVGQLEIPRNANPVSNLLIHFNLFIYCFRVVIRYQCGFFGCILHGRPENQNEINFGHRLSSTHSGAKDKSLGNNKCAGS